MIQQCPSKGWGMNDERIHECTVRATGLGLMLNNSFRRTTPRTTYSTCATPPLPPRVPLIAIDLSNMAPSSATRGHPPAAEWQVGKPEASSKLAACVSSVTHVSGWTLPLDAAITVHVGGSSRAQTASSGGAMRPECGPTFSLSRCRMRFWRSARGRSRVTARPVSTCCIVTSIGVPCETLSHCAKVLRDCVLARCNLVVKQSVNHYRVEVYLEVSIEPKFPARPGPELIYYKIYIMV